MMGDCFLGILVGKEAASRVAALLAEAGGDLGSAHQVSSTRVNNDATCSRAGLLSLVLSTASGPHGFTGPGIGGSGRGGH